MSHLNCSDYVMEKWLELHLPHKDHGNLKGGHQVLLCPSLPSATDSKSLLKIRNRAIHSHSDLFPLSTTFCLLPVSHSVIQTSTFFNTPTRPLQSVGSLVPSYWQSLHGHLFCRWCNTPTCTLTLSLKNVSRWWETCSPGRCPRQRRIRGGYANISRGFDWRNKCYWILVNF